ncbi:hypothetical protein GMORB2_6269 [Geosmithia morbida]|uniref:Uncharacterized protein n=1 Tax=Geosmithia morbida TaxID=1094350 RepID=A0A9P4YXM3_9HYPO|nr:uncharacterized protein GMORB2_6269 [Geosmithia morbida]KAF4123568.1 hypothetical protein GMORB2_6269 [Geosmithia morbida]
MAAAVSGIILIALTGALTSKYLTKASYYYSTPPVLVLAPQAGIAFVWAMVDGACLAFRRNHEGVHPGLVVVLDLLLWLGLIAGTILFSFMHYVSDPYYSDDYYDFDADDYDELSWVHDLHGNLLR